MPAPERWFGWVTLCLATIVGAAPLQPGAARSDVIAALGEPSGAIVSGAREVLTYPEGKITLNDHKVLSSTFDLELTAQDRAASSPPESSAPLPPNVRKARGTVTVTRGKDLAWFRDLEEAKAQGEEQHKQLLVLFTGEPAQSWTPIFNRAVVYNPGLLQELQREFVLVKLTCPTPSAVDAGDADADDAKRLETFRSRTIGGRAYPALAIVTNDGRRAAEVNLEGAADAQGWMEGFVKAAIQAAKEKPLRSRGGVSGTFVLAALGGLLVLAWLVKQ